MSTIFTEDAGRYGYDFIDSGYIPEGKDEYYLRNFQLEELYKSDSERSRLSAYRRLNEAEINALKANGNTSANWDDFFVSEPFEADFVRNSFFAGRVRLGRLQAGLIRHHDYNLRCGIENSRIISCDIGDNCAIYDCRYLSHYIIGNGVILSSIDEMNMTNHAKFGEGILKQDEDESVRITIDLLNETGGRAVLPFREMLPADAYMWTVYRDDSALMRAFFNITQNNADSRRGFYGVVGHGAVIKHCRTIKDVWVGPAAYIKGANKLKNLTIKSDRLDPAQIGEGVEAVNGIIGYGCRVFYGSKAVRFVLGDNCALKYGARLIHSVLGDNSTVSCCEVLNNLVFPAHEQHHNNSFLIATMVMGQSNMAAGANVGSNHNSRGNDGEIIAGRGFWPGLSSALKHNSRFASFVLIAKGNYPAELDIPLPFSLLVNSACGTRRELMPAYWWMYNLYALERNSWKFKDRDKRVFKGQHIEMNYLAPDTVNEIICAMELLEEWAGGREDEPVSCDYMNKVRLRGKKLLLSAQAISLNVGALERSSQPLRIIKPAEGYRAYREMLLYYAVKVLVEAGEWKTENAGFITESERRVPEAWINLGGQLVPETKVLALREAVKCGELCSWAQIHAEYDKLWNEYPEDRARHARATLDWLGAGGESAIKEAIRIQKYIETQVYNTKLKDYTDSFRNITYRNKAERDAALGRLEDNSFIKISREKSAAFIKMCETQLGK
ncbi:MAG: DUF4954 family protein [Termitinemataceae bacterium]|nr:MAG: DUF4954 family protein [Termitinemataceae bacterium]